MHAYLMIILADALLALNFAISKKYQNNYGHKTYQGLFFNAIGSFFTSIMFFVLTDFKPELTLYSFIMASLQSILALAYSLIGFYIMRLGGMSLYTLFLMSGGMIIPYVWGIVFLDEGMSILRLAGCLLITVAIAVSNFQKDENNKKALLLCAAVFILNGFVSVTSKVHQINKVYETISTNSFMFWSSITKAILCTAFLLNKKKESSTKKLMSKNVILLSAASAILGGVASFVLLHSAKSIPATMLYPLNTGGTIILSALAGVICYKEKLTKKQMIGIIVCFSGTCMFL